MKRSLAPPMFTTATLAATAAICFCAFPALAQAPKDTAATARKVELTTSACAQVKDGDVLVFDWNPGFDHTGVVAGMGRAFLIFAMRGQEQAALDGRGGIPLVAQMTRAVGSRGSSIEPLPNGFFRLQFKLNLHNADPGEYHLVNARGDALVASGYQGDRPQMSNSPLNLPFCLNVGS